MLPNDLVRIVESLAKRVRALEVREITSGVLNLDEQAAPLGTPISGRGRLYEKADGKLYFMNDAGVETCLTP